MKKTLVSVWMLACLGIASVWADNRESVSADESVSVPSASACQWEFMMAQAEPSAAELAAFSAEGRWGKEVAYYYDLFKDTYITKEEIVPGDPVRRTVIRKPDIYNAVRNIEKSLKKAVRKNELSQADLEKQFSHVLKASLAAIDSDTQTLEEALSKNRKNPKALLDIFQRISLKNIY